MNKGRWRSLVDLPDEVSKERPVLMLASDAHNNYDAAAADHQIWMPVVAYGSKRDGWRDVLLSAGHPGRREIEVLPVAWAPIPMPLPYPAAVERSDLV
jgi:hypothetical protein